MDMLHNEKKCDHTSVGMLVWQDDKLLLIERKKFPFGYAPPAGHVDGDVSFEIAATRELQEEVGLTARSLSTVGEEDIQNMCRRKGGTWHHWKVYQVQADGEIKGNADETKQVGWFTRQQIKQLAQRTEAYASGKISEEEWQMSPGLEQVWYDWFLKLDIL